MTCNSWGMYPIIDCKRRTFDSKSALKAVLDQESELIPRGNGRSYGDSALNNTVVDVRPHDFFLDFIEICFVVIPIIGPAIPTPLEWNIAVLAPGIR